MEGLLINPPLKGERNYIQGPDICSFIFAKYQSVSNFKISIKKMSRNSLIVMNRSSKLDRSKIAGEFTFSDDNEKSTKSFYLVESDRRLTQRIEYDESELRRECIISAEQFRITLVKPKNFTTLEAIVSCNKLLATSSVCEQKWLFTKLQLNYFPLPENEINLLLTGHVGSIMTNTEIQANGIKIGTIIFNGVRE